MLENLQILVVTFAAIIGSLFSAALGWGESAEPFNGRKFAMSLLRAVISGVLFAIASYSGLDTIASGWTYFIAFLGGIGIDAGGHRLSGSISAIIPTSQTPELPPSTPTETPTQPSTTTPPITAVVPSDCKAVNVDDYFAGEQIQTLLDSGYKRWQFPNGFRPVMYAVSPPVLGLKLTLLGTQPSWIAVMDPSWHPINTHPS